MDNQKSTEGSARDQDREGAGASMGKDAGSSGGTGSGMSQDMSKDMSRSAADIHQAIDKAAEAAQPVVERMASTAHAGVDKVSGALSGASKRMEDKSRQLTEAYQHFADTGREYVRASPATSLLVAVGAGFILSKLLGGRR